MSKANQSGRDAEEYRVISARVPSTLADRVEELTEESLSEEIRSGLRNRIETMEESRLRRPSMPGGRSITRSGPESRS